MAVVPSFFHFHLLILCSFLRHFFVVSSFFVCCILFMQCQQQEAGGRSRWASCKLLLLSRALQPATCSAPNIYTGMVHIVWKCKERVRTHVINQTVLIFRTERSHGTTGTRSVYLPIAARHHSMRLRRTTRRCSSTYSLVLVVYSRSTCIDQSF